MSQESDSAGPLTVWIARLQQKVNILEEASRLAGDRQKLLKELDTCDTYWKKVYVRAKENPTLYLITACACCKI